MKTLCIAILFFLLVSSATAQTTAFTYQGRLNDGPNPANGNYLLRFELFDSVASGSQVGTTIDDVEIVAVNGIFTTELDFGEAAFADGQDLFIQISVRRNTGESYTTLTPRQPLTSTPYAVKARLAQQAMDAAHLGGIESTRFVKDDDPALTDDRNPLPGSGNYIQNSSDVQPSADFNISGEGRANVLAATSHFTLRDDPVLKVELNGTTKLGIGAGAVNTGANGAYFGYQAGLTNLNGQGNSFFGFQAGMNSGTSHNSFFGYASGRSSNPGTNNAFFGSEAGLNNVDGDANSFFGRAAGQLNTTGDQNTYIGAFSGGSPGNFGVTLVGTLTSASGGNLTNATAIGANAVVSQSNSLVLGNNANVGIGTSSPQSKLTVVGLIETTSGGVKFPDGTIQTSALGSLDVIRNQTTQQAGANFNITGTGTAGTLNATSQFNYFGNRIMAAPGIGNFVAGLLSGNDLSTGSNNTFVGTAAGTENTTGQSNSFFGNRAGLSNIDGHFNVFVGSGAGEANVGGDSNTFIGTSSGFNHVSGNDNTYIGTSSGAGNSSGFQNTYLGGDSGQLASTGSQNTYIGYQAGRSMVGSGNTALGRTAGNSAVTATQVTLLGSSANVGADNLAFATAVGAGSIVTSSNTIVLGRQLGQDKVRIPGLGIGGSTGLCLNFATEIATCSSSLRYKTNINAFRSGFDLVKRLNPITFDWKDAGARDLGLGAEDVAEVSELLVHRNKEGEIEGVKYDRITLVLINAVKEQQAQIDALRKELDELKRAKGGVK